MAKVNAPLFSFGASGKLGDALVYFPWKGLDVVRSYVVPSNPRTAGQVTQRGYFTEAVSRVHLAQALAANPLNGADVAAYALLASTEPTPRTWFNQIVKLWADVEIAGFTPVIYHDGTISDPTPAAFECLFQIEEETGSTMVAGKFYFGTSKTALIHSFIAAVTAGATVGIVAGDLSAFLTAGNKYFMQFRPDVADGCEGAESGIYSFVAV
ncbi:hypothetical protein ES708_17037 [subsurface metagenome]